MVPDHPLDDLPDRERLAVVALGIGRQKPVEAVVRIVGALLLGNSARIRGYRRASTIPNRGHRQRRFAYTHAGPRPARAASPNPSAHTRACAGCQDWCRSRQPRAGGLGTEGWPPPRFTADERSRSKRSRSRERLARVSFKPFMSAFPWFSRPCQPPACNAALQHYKPTTTRKSKGLGRAVRIATASAIASPHVAGRPPSVGGNPPKKEPGGPGPPVSTAMCGRQVVPCSDLRSYNLGHRKSRRTGRRLTTQSCETVDGTRATRKVSPSSSFGIVETVEDLAQCITEACRCKTSGIARCRDPLS